MKAQDRDTLNVLKKAMAGNDWLHFNDLSYAPYHHLTRQAYSLLDNRASNISGLHSLDAWKDRQQRVKQILTDLIAPFPKKILYTRKSQRQLPSRKHYL